MKNCCIGNSVFTLTVFALKRRMDLIDSQKKHVVNLERIVNRQFIAMKSYFV